MVPCVRLSRRMQMNGSSGKSNNLPWLIGNRPVGGGQWAVGSTEAWVLSSLHTTPWFVVPPLGGNRLKGGTTNSGTSRRPRQAASKAQGHKLGSSIRGRQLYG